MSYPTRYTRQYDYVAYQNANPSRPLPATKVNADFNAIARSFAETGDFIERFTREDGELANGSVGYDQLAPALQSAGIAPATGWRTGVAYAAGDAVINDAKLYRCLIAHTSGTFATDLAAGKWTYVADLVAPDGDVIVFTTLASAAATEIDDAVSVVETLGHSEPGDNGGARYYRIPTTTAAAWRFTSADGQMWSLLDREVTPEMFGAFDGEDCTAGLKALSSWVNLVGAGLGGCRIKHKPGAEYRIWPDGGAAPSTIFNLSGVRGISWDYNGSKIITDYTFAGAYGVYLFGGGCKDITLNEPWFVEESASAYSATIGTRFITIHETVAPWGGNYRINNPRQSGGSGFLIVSCDPTVGGYTSNIQVINPKLDNLYYGINCQANGNNLFVRGYEYSNLDRAFFVYNVAHHDVEIIGDGGPLNQILIECVPYPTMSADKRRTSDIKVRYRNVPPTAAAGGNLVSLQFIQPVAPMTVSAIASNGSGGSRLTVNSSANAATGQTWFFNVTGTTGINGEQTVTVIDSTHVDVSVAFVGTGIGYASVPGAMDDIDLHMHCENASGVAGNQIFAIGKVAHGGAADTSLRGYEVSLKLSGYVSGYNNASVPCVAMFSDAITGTWTGETIRARVEDFTVKGGPNCAVNFNCGVVENMLFKNVKGGSGTTWTFTSADNALFENVDVPGLKMGVGFGTLDPYPTIKSKFTAFNATGNSLLAVGQSATRGGALFWTYNASVGSALLQVATVGYSNPLHIDGSVVNIGTGNSATVNINNGGVAPVGTGAYVRKSYADALIAANDAMVFKGATDCSTNPNYPAADRGDTYRVSVAGKIGGASGVVVEVGDIFICGTDGTLAGTQAAVGANWFVIQTNIDGAVVGPASATADAIALFNGATGKIIKDSTVALSADGTFASNVDTKVPTEKAAKTYVDARVNNRNYLINSSGEVAQVAVGSQADGTYDFDQWLTLTQSNPITASSVADAENSTPFMMRSLQANAVAQRFGRIQWLEKLFCRELRGQTVTLSARVRMSASTTLRYAIVEWTGTADAITKDVVLDWTNGTFTAGQFFTSTSTTIVATGSIALTANTLTDITALSGAVSSSMNNLAVIFWTDSTQAQNVTLDIGKVKLEKSAVATPFAARSYAQELADCKRYYQITAPFSLDLPAIVNTGIGVYSAGSITYSPEMRTAPTLTAGGSPTTANVSGVAIPVAASADARGFAWNMTSAAAGRAYYYNTASANARL